MQAKEYRYAEKVLYSYRSNLEAASTLALELDILREAGDVKAQQYAQMPGKVSGISDPVSEHVSEVMRLEARLKRVMRRVSAVDRLREDLVNGRVITITKPENLVIILDKYYIAGVTIYEFLSTSHWSRSIFYVRRRELVMITGEYLRA